MSKFIVIATGGLYRVSVSNNLSTPFHFLALGENTESFDLWFSGLDSARYIRIEYFNTIIELAAIHAIYHESIDVNQAAPSVSNLLDFWT